MRAIDSRRPAGSPVRGPETHSARGPRVRLAPAALALALLGLALCVSPAAASGAPRRSPVVLHDSASPAAPGELLIADRDDAIAIGSSGRPIPLAARLAEVLARHRLDHGAVLWSAQGMRFLRLQSSDPAFDPARAAADLKASGEVVSAVPNLKLRLFNTIPDDAFLPNQWYVNDGGVGDVRLPLAWDTERGSASVRIGIMDTGVDLTHPDLASQIWTTPGEIPGNGLDDDGDGYVDDVHGWDFGNNDNDPDPHAVIDTLDYGLDVGFHGTMVAGIASAATNNSEGIAGAGWHCSIVPLKVVNTNGDILLSAVSEAFGWASAHHLEVLNMSFGTADQPGVPEYFQALVDQATAAGVLCVASAGNDGTSAVNYPAGCTGVLSVGSTDPDNTRSSFSNWGSTVRIAAPGSSMWSALCQNYVIDDFSQLFYEVFFYWDGYNPYMYGDGTSFAAPLTSGVCALVRSRHPDWPPLTVLSQVIASGDALVFDEPMGPKLNAANAVSASLLSATAPAPSAEMTAAPNPFARQLTARFALAGAERVRLSVFDCSGRMVRELVDAEFPAGQQQLAWDGRDTRGAPVPDGVYFLELRRGPERTRCRIVHLR
jgi:subtilisin family serine protease